MKTEKTNIFSDIGSVLSCALVGMLTNTSAEKKSTLLWLALEADLKTALKNRELIIHYQPIVDLRTGKISGMEALLRWQHPRFGIISPRDLMPLAEATGLALPIGEWVLQEACFQASRWHKEILRSSTLKLSINISLYQLRQGAFLDMLDRIVENAKMDPKLLALELPQNANLEKEDVPILNALSKRGIGLSIDDFGTANSKWSTLKSFGVIKIDNAFIQTVNSHKDNSRIIVSAMFAMAENLGIKTLAEGVETQAQYEFLKDKNCDFMQGFYFSKPLSSAEFTQLLRSRY